MRTVSFFERLLVSVLYRFEANYGQGILPAHSPTRFPSSIGSRQTRELFVALDDGLSFRPL